tara:strand:- start:33 stop:236 length:204 start_codon:yes stop_codon:yes gene_type:complete
LPDVHTEQSDDLKMGQTYRKRLIFKIDFQKLVILCVQVEFTKKVNRQQFSCLLEINSILSELTLKSI